MISEAERLKTCEIIAYDMASAGLGWNYDAIERLTRPAFSTNQMCRLAEQIADVLIRSNRHMMRRKIRKVYGL